MQMVKEAKLAATEVESYYPSITYSKYMIRFTLCFIVPGSNYRRNRRRACLVCGQFECKIKWFLHQSEKIVGVKGQ